MVVISYSSSLILQKIKHLPFLPPPHPLSPPSFGKESYHSNPPRTMLKNKKRKDVPNPRKESIQDWTRRMLWDLNWFYISNSWCIYQLKEIIGQQRDIEIKQLSKWLYIPFFGNFPYLFTWNCIYIKEDLRRA